MAIITIPTSVAGVSIPQNLVSPLTGPLSALFGNPYQLSQYSYPRDLGSATRQHVVKFTINEIEPASIDTDKLWGFAKDLLSGDFTPSEENKLIFKGKKTRAKAYINLYMPDTMQMTYNAGYNDLRLTDLAAKAAGGVLSGLGSLLGGKNSIIGNITSAVGGGIASAPQNDFVKLGLASQGYAINPQLQLLFDGIDFRTYQLVFTFTPYSKQEAEAVTNIIKLFKKHAMPTVAGTGAKGMFMIPPSTFNLQFLFNGKENDKIHKVAESVITSVDVNYAPNGWSTYDDGTPVQTQLTLQFKEIEIVDSTKVDQGY